MDLSTLLPTVVNALVDEVAQSGPDCSPLAGVDPLGRADVAASRILERVAGGYGPVAQQAYSRVKPSVDTLLEQTFKGTRFGKRPTRRQGKRVRSRQVVRT